MQEPGAGCALFAPQYLHTYFIVRGFDVCGAVRLQRQRVTSSQIVSSLAEKKECKLLICRS